VPRLESSFPAPASALTLRQYLPTAGAPRRPRSPETEPRQPAGPDQGVAAMPGPESVVWCILAALVGLVVGGVAGYLFVRRQDRISLNSARNKSNDIIAQARKEAENTVKEAELKAKDELFKKREDFNREVEKGRGELRDQERRLEKREDLLEQKHQ